VPDSRGFQAFSWSKGETFHRFGKVSSIMSAKLLSIMPANAWQVTPD
jgi:hypothetical protein